MWVPTLFQHRLPPCLRPALLQEARAHAEVRSALAAKERALSDTQRAVRDLESHAAAMAAQQAAQISTLQKELIKWVGAKGMWKCACWCAWAAFIHLGRGCWGWLPTLPPF